MAFIDVVASGCSLYRTILQIEIVREGIRCNPGWCNIWNKLSIVNVAKYQKSKFSKYICQFYTLITILFNYYISWDENNKIKSKWLVTDTMGAARSTELYRPAILRDAFPSQLWAEKHDQYPSPPSWDEESGGDIFLVLYLLKI